MVGLLHHCCHIVFFQSFDLEIRFEHPRNYHFNRGTYAQTGFPPEEFIYFNDRYNWTRPKLLIHTALHEIGHFLGLDHVDDINALMFEAIIDYNNLKENISSGDIAGIQVCSLQFNCRVKRVPLKFLSLNFSLVPKELYGKKENDGDDRLCSNKKIDAATFFAFDGQGLVFKGERAIFLYNFARGEKSIQNKKKKLTGPYQWYFTQSINDTELTMQRRSKWDSVDTIFYTCGKNSTPCDLRVYTIRVNKVNG